MLGKSVLKAGIVLAAAVVMATSVHARDLRVGSGAPPPHPATSHLYNGLVEYLAEESGGKLTATLLGPEVVSLGQIKEALQTGLLDVGNLLPLYYPAELPNFAQEATVQVEHLQRVAAYLLGLAHNAFDVRTGPEVFFRIVVVCAEEPVALKALGVFGKVALLYVARLAGPVEVCVLAVELRHALNGLIVVNLEALATRFALREVAVPAGEPEVAP